MEQERRQIIGVAGDGNCLFRAILASAGWDADSHEVLRGLLCDHIETHLQDYEAFMEMTADQYLTRMRTLATWGGVHVELVAAARVLDTKFKFSGMKHLGNSLRE